MSILIIFDNVWFFTRLWSLMSKSITIKRCPCTQSDFTKFWMNSLVAMNKDQWKSSEFISLMNKDLWTTPTSHFVIVESANLGPILAPSKFVGKASLRQAPMCTKGRTHLQLLVANSSPRQTTSLRTLLPW
jgi:hypothetical protein